MNREGTGVTGGILLASNSLLRDLTAGGGQSHWRVVMRGQTHENKPKTVDRTTVPIMSESRTALKFSLTSAWLQDRVLEKMSGCHMPCKGALTTSSDNNYGTRCRRILEARYFPMDSAIVVYNIAWKHRLGMVFDCKHLGSLPLSVKGTRDCQVGSSSSSSAIWHRPVCHKTCFSIKAPLGNACTATNSVGAA